MRWPVTPSGRETLGHLVAWVAAIVLPYVVSIVHGIPWGAVAAVAMTVTVVAGLGLRDWRHRG